MSEAFDELVVIVPTRKRVRLAAILGLFVTWMVFRLAMPFVIEGVSAGWSR